VPNDLYGIDLAIFVCLLKCSSPVAAWRLVAGVFPSMVRVPDDGSRLGVKELARLGGQLEEFLHAIRGAEAPAGDRFEWFALDERADDSQ
jgi:hypothetical protein